jgi:hypothetical protein
MGSVQFAKTLLTEATMSLAEGFGMTIIVCHADRKARIFSSVEHTAV